MLHRPQVYLLYGSSGWIGGMCKQLLEEGGKWEEGRAGTHKEVHCSKIRLEDSDPPSRHPKTPRPQPSPLFGLLLEPASAQSTDTMLPHIHSSHHTPSSGEEPGGCSDIHRVEGGSKGT